MKEIYIVHMNVGRAMYLYVTEMLIFPQIYL